MLPCVSRNLPLRCLTPVGVARATAPHASLAFCAAEIQAETEPPTTSAATQRAGAIVMSTDNSATSNNMKLVHRS